MLATETSDLPFSSSTTQIHRWTNIHTANESTNRSAAPSMYLLRDDFPSNHTGVELH